MAAGAVSVWKLRPHFQKMSLRQHSFCFCLQFSEKYKQIWVPLFTFFIVCGKKQMGNKWMFSYKQTCETAPPVGQERGMKILSQQKQPKLCWPFGNENEELKQVTRSSLSDTPVHPAAAEAFTSEANHHFLFGWQKWRKPPLQHHLSWIAHGRLSALCSANGGIPDRLLLHEPYVTISSGPLMLIRGGFVREYCAAAWVFGVRSFLPRPIKSARLQAARLTGIWLDFSWWGEKQFEWNIWILGAHCLFLLQVADWGHKAKTHLALKFLLLWVHVIAPGGFSDMPGGWGSRRAPFIIKRC